MLRPDAGIDEADGDPLAGGGLSPQEAPDHRRADVGGALGGLHLLFVVRVDRLDPGQAAQCGHRVRRHDHRHRIQQDLQPAARAAAGHRALRAALEVVLPVLEMRQIVDRLAALRLHRRSAPAPAAPERLTERRGASRQRGLVKLHDDADLFLRRRRRESRRRRLVP